MQESLTNVIKHAGPGVDTTIALRWEGDELHLAVTDDGPKRLDRTSPRSPTSGYGLLGLRERATAVGARLEAGRLAGNGFHVTATLPRSDLPAIDDGRAELPPEAVETESDLRKAPAGETAT